MTRVLALGTFDLLHPGHVNFFKQARKLGEELWVAVNPDDFVTRYKRQPILYLDERLAMVRALSVVDRAFVNWREEDSKPAIEHAARDAQWLIIVHGDDWTGASYMQQLGVDEDFLRDVGASIAYVPYTEGISTSEVVGRVLYRGPDKSR